MYEKPKLFYLKCMCSQNFFFYVLDRVEKPCHAVQFSVMRLSKLRCHTAMEGEALFNFTKKIFFKQYYPSFGWIYCR